MSIYYTSASNTVVSKKNLATGFQVEVADIHLIYTSLAVGRPNQQDLEELLEQSRQRNKRQNITGMLLFKSGVYLQVLEGDENDVHEIFSDIEKDPRNTQVTKLLDEKIVRRDFPNWSMGFKRLDDSIENEAYNDVFDGNFDRHSLYQSRSLAVNLILKFSNNI